MRRYVVTLRGDFTKTENFTDRDDAVKTARKWRACYNGVVTIKDNATGKIENI